MGVGLTLALGVEVPARAAPPAATDSTTQVVEGHVLSVEDGTLIVDLTAKDGLSPGDSLELWRPLKLIHPVTHKLVLDRYRIGVVRVAQVRTAVSLARVDGAPERPPAVGDVVTIERARPAPAVAPLPASAAAPPLAEPARPAPAAPPAPVVLGEEARAANVPGDPEEHAVSALFQSLRGASLTTRIKKYEKYGQTHPESRFTRVLLEEAAALRELVLARVGAQRDLPVARNFAPPESTLDQTPLTVAIELSGRVEGAVLQARNDGEVAYRPTPMVRVGPGYYSADLPADRVKSPRLEYFIEATRPSGEAVPVAGTAETPIVTKVHAVPKAAPPLGHESSVSLLSDFADYNRLRKNDYVFQTEGTFGMRFQDIGVRALRSGFGVYRGVGGSISDLDVDHLSPRSVGLTYGHLEGEFGIRPAVSLIARAVLGLRDDGTTGGAQLHIRIGSDKSTNLMLGGEVLGGVGLRGITQLELEPRGRVPITVRSEVTNQPVGDSTNRDPVFLSNGKSTGASDIGVRAILQVGYRIVDPLVIAVRASYQGRTINHAGPGVGGALEYRW
ncbi:MAG TPA: hypothetical protein VHE30_20880 [Polyangiaceae bacterium]|nr:hypothetical protein [Polyangiaceae bacterium]